MAPVITYNRGPTISQGRDLLKVYNTAEQVTASPPIQFSKQVHQIKLAWSLQIHSIWSRSAYCAEYRWFGKIKWKEESEIEAIAKSSAANAVMHANVANAEATHHTFQRWAHCANSVQKDDSSSCVLSSQADDFGEKVKEIKQRREIANS